MTRRSFIDTLRDLRAGDVIDQLDDKLQKLTQAVQRTAKGGTLQLTIDVKPLRGSTEAVVVRATIKAKEPQFDDNGTVMFPTPEGNLTRNHPKQMDIPGITLASVGPGAASA